MKSRRRGILAGAAAVGLLAVGAALAMTLAYPALPHPSQADRDELLRWLVTKDLEQVPAATRLVLAERLDAEFSGGIDWEATRQRLDESHRRRLWQNVPWLLGAWLADKAAAYDDLPPSGRPALLEECLGNLDRWRRVEALRPARNPMDGEGKQGGEGLSPLLFEGVQRSKESATPEQCRRIDRLLAGIQARWLMRELQGLLPAR